MLYGRYAYAITTSYTESWDGVREPDPPADPDQSFARPGPSGSAGPSRRGRGNSVVQNAPVSIVERVFEDDGDDVIFEAAKSHFELTTNDLSKATTSSSTGSTGSVSIPQCVFNVKKKTATTSSPSAGSFNQNCHNTMGDLKPVNSRIDEAYHEFVFEENDPFFADDWDGVMEEDFKNVPPPETHNIEKLRGNNITKNEFLQEPWNKIDEVKSNSSGIVPSVSSTVKPNINSSSDDCPEILTRIVKKKFVFQKKMKSTSKVPLHTLVPYTPSPPSPRISPLPSVLCRRAQCTNPSSPVSRPSGDQSSRRTQRRLPRKRSQVDNFQVCSDESSDCDLNVSNLTYEKTPSFSDNNPLFRESRLNSTMLVEDWGLDKDSDSSTTSNEAFEVINPRPNNSLSNSIAYSRSQIESTHSQPVSSNKSSSIGSIISKNVASSSSSNEFFPPSPDPPPKTLAPVIKKKFVFKKKSRISSHLQEPLESPTPTTPEPQRPVLKRKKLKRSTWNPFVNEEVDLFGDEEDSSDDEELGTNSEKLNLSFVSTSNSPRHSESQQVRYIRSVKDVYMNTRKPGKKALDELVLQGLAANTCSGYEEDSFVVDNDEVEFEEIGEFTQALQLAQTAIDKETPGGGVKKNFRSTTRNKPREPSPEIQQPKRRKRIIVLSDDEED